MKNAVNTIARGIEAGALKAGASQYLEAIEAAKRQLADNQILIVTISSDIDTTSSLKEGLKLYTYKSSVKSVGSLDDINPIEIYLPNTVEEIQDGAFPYKASLEKITIPPSLKYVGAGAFLGDDAIQEDIWLPDGLETIREEAFAGVGAKKGISIHIPESVTAIGADAFAEIAHIYYNGTATWQEGNTYWGATAMN